VVERDPYTSTPTSSSFFVPNIFWNYTKSGAIIPVRVTNNGEVYSPISGIVMFFMLFFPLLIFALLFMMAYKYKPLRKRSLVGTRKEKQHVNARKTTER
jgi:hypothetical protein